MTSRKYCSGATIKVPSDLGDAILLHREYNLEIPDHVMIRGLQPEDKVELTREGERFWVIIDEVIETDNHFEFIGQVESDLTYIHPFIKGDCIFFSGQNILNIFGHEWKNNLRL